MPLDEGYPELDSSKKEGKERLRIDVTPSDRPQIDPSITPGKNLDPSIPDEKMKDLKKKFYPGLEQ